MQTLTDEITKHLPQNGESRRIFYGRGRAFPGYQDLLIDHYGELIFVTLFAERSAAWLDELAAVLHAQFPQVECIAVQHRDRPGTPVVILYGTMPVTPRAHEAGLDYLLRPLTGQNIGFFLDMENGRKLVRRLADGKKILNLFAYSCSFSVAALAGGARQVVNVDMNRGALELGRQNHRLNRLDLRAVSFLTLEIFRSFSRLRKLGPFDLIICDPPTNQGKSFTAEIHWPRLLSKLAPLVSPDGEIMACLNAPHLTPDYLVNLFHEHLPEFSEQKRIFSGADFPEEALDRGLSIQHFSHKI